MTKILVFILSLVVLTANAQDSSFESKLNKILSTLNEDLNIAVVIANPSKNQLIYSKNQTRSFHPASTLKLLTAYSALFFLGKNYQYQTHLYVAQIPHQAILIGNVYIKFSGDPSLTRENIAELINTLSRNHITKIWGKVIIDDSLHNDHDWPVGTVGDDTKFCFCAPISAIIINKNCINANINVTAQKKISVDIDKINEVNLFPQLHFSKNPNSLPDLIVKNNNSYILSGPVNHSLPLKIAVQNNRLFSKHIIADALIENKIVASQGIDYGTTPTGAILFATHYSATVPVLIKDMLKNSDNIIANALFRTIGLQTQVNDSWSSASEQIKNLLASKLQVTQLVMQDGAGASVYDLIKPRDLITLLNAIYLSENYTYFAEALPRGGMDGTLKNRFLTRKVVVNAKTGTATGISSLAGFIKTQKKHLLSFVIMINGGTQSSEQYKKLEDEICYLIDEKL